MTEEVAQFANEHVNEHFLFPLSRKTANPLQRLNLIPQISPMARVLGVQFVYARLWRSISIDIFTLDKKWIRII